MTADDHGPPDGLRVSGAHLWASLGLFALCNLAAAAVVPLIALALA